MVGFPLLLIPLAIYNIIVFLMPGVSLAEPIVTVPLMSGAEWPLTLSDMLLALGIVVLLLEVIKGARPGAKFLTDHLLSLIVFGAAAAEFLLWPRFGNSTYFLLALLALADFISGLALRARRGTQVVAPAAVSRREARKVAAEPQFDPAPPPPAAAAPLSSVPAATSVAESVLLEHPQPKIVHPEGTPAEPAPELVPSGPSSGNGSPRSPDAPAH
jgi:hypothetical protein